ncbi:MAG: ABC transporter ATP-binding protein [Bradymonadales bacterium]|nr:MAG: ABC transporter ATP-binding protein [Bradymonadales bacterium]
MTAGLNFEEVEVSFGSKQVLRQTSFALEPSEISCLLGPSGSGKTTCLRAIAGFQKINSGRILLNENLLSKRGFQLRPEARGVGFVFQDFALFPHLTVFENIAFGVSHLSAVERKSRVDRLLEMVGLGALSKQYPHQISGGEKQRVAIARALAPDPRLLLLDEPLSQLDPELRTHLASEIRSILKSLGTSALMVTHSQSEAFDFGDRIAVMKDGQIQQFAEAYRLYHEPKNSFVADFIGRGSFIEGEVVGPNCIRLELGLLQAKLPSGLKPQDRVMTLVRPDDLVFDPESPVKLRVISRSFRGPYFLYRLETPSGSRVLALIPSHDDFQEGEEIGVRLEMEHVICFRDCR